MSDNLEKDWKEWLAAVMTSRPKGSMYLNSERGVEVTSMCLDIEREDFSWHRSDVDTFWLDVQLFVKYKLDDEQIRFICKLQPGVINHKRHAKERNAYAEMIRGFDKLKKIAIGDDEDA